MFVPHPQTDTDTYEDHDQQVGMTRHTNVEWNSHPPLRTAIVVQGVGWCFHAKQELKNGPIVWTDNPRTPHDMGCPVISVQDIEMGVMKSLLEYLTIDKFADAIGGLWTDTASSFTVNMTMILYTLFELSKYDRLGMWMLENNALEKKVLSRMEEFRGVCFTFVGDNENM